MEGGHTVPRNAVRFQNCFQTCKIERLFLSASKFYNISKEFAATQNLHYNPSPPTHTHSHTGVLCYVVL